jgi:hypothetical protein
MLSTRCRAIVPLNVDGETVPTTSIAVRHRCALVPCGKIVICGSIADRGEPPDIRHSSGVTDPG